MKAIISISLLQVLFITAYPQQFYIRGEVKDENGILMQNVKIVQHSTGLLFRTGNYGTFGIPTKNHIDTLTISYPGYQDEKVVFKNGIYISAKLKIQPVVITDNLQNKLVSLTLNAGDEWKRKWLSGNETYADLVENRFLDVSKHPETGISLNIDKASYPNIRRFINLGMVVPPDAVRIEEMLNYFNLKYQEPDNGQLFRIDHQLANSPWNRDRMLFFINVSSEIINVDSLPPAHLVFLVDISGSMDMPNRLPMLKSAFRSMASSFREKDTVSIVIYGGAAGIKLFPTCGAETMKICQAFDELEPGGSTPGESGIRLAYMLAKKHFIKGGNNRIILATDGDFNVGVQTEQELEELITRNRESGIYLTCLGVGMGNYKDSKIQVLARRGNGNFAYIDSYREAEKVLLKEFTQNLYTVAEDAVLNIRFNPSLISEYRLVGFDNKLGALQNEGAVIEGGELGSGNSIMAVFEILLRKDDKILLTDRHFADITLKYHLPGDPAARYMRNAVEYDPVIFKNLDKEYQFATAVIMFGLMLKNSEFGKEINWGDIQYLSGESARPADVIQNQFTELVYKARNLYTKNKKRKKT